MSLSGLVITSLSEECQLLEVLFQITYSNIVHKLYDDEIMKMMTSMNFMNFMMVIILIVLTKKPVRPNVIVSPFNVLIN